MEKQLPVINAIDIVKMRPPHKNVAVAMVAACIVHYWGCGVELEAIILNRHKFNLYKDFVRVVYGEQYSSAEDFWWHGIQIRCERIYSNVPLHVEIKKAKAEA